MELRVPTIPWQCGGASGRVGYDPRAPVKTNLRMGSGGFEQRAEGRDWGCGSGFYRRAATLCLRALNTWGIKALLHGSLEGQSERASDGEA